MARPLSYILPDVLTNAMNKRFGFVSISALAGASGIEESVLGGNLRGDNEMKMGNALAIVDALQVTPQKGLEILRAIHAQREGK